MSQETKQTTSCRRLEKMIQKRPKVGYEYANFTNQFNIETKIGLLWDTNMLNITVMLIKTTQNRPTVG